MLQDFSARTEEALKYYVYLLVDPRDGKIFYVGKGKQSGENAIRLRDWLLSEEGQRFVEAQGYVSAG